MTGIIGQYQMYDPVTGEWVTTTPILSLAAAQGGVRGLGTNQLSTPQRLSMNLIVTRPGGGTETIEGLPVDAPALSSYWWEFWYGLVGVGDYLAKLDLLGEVDVALSGQIVEWLYCLGSIATGIWGGWVPLVSGVSIPPGYDVAIGVAWQNISVVTVVGHVILSITYPSARVETPAAYQDNYVAVGPGGTVIPVFRFTPDEEGSYSLRAELHGEAA